MHTALLVIQSILSVLITGAILLQAQGSGFGTTWSGGGETYHTRRGLEKVLFYFTIGAVIVFTIVALAIIVV